MPWLSSLVKSFDRSLLLDFSGIRADSIVSGTGTKSNSLRELHARRRALARRAGQRERAVVQKNDLFRQGQPEAVAGGFVGLEGEEEARDVRRIDSHAAVLDDNAPVRYAHVHRARSLLLHRFDRVAHEVLHRAAEEIRIAGDLGWLDRKSTRLN